MPEKREKVLLVIRDGWGYRKEKQKNAIASANTPFHDTITKTHPTFLIRSSGKAVGLPNGYQGNSEVGHITIGAGRVVEQSLVRINSAIKDGSFFKKKGLKKAVNNCKKNNTHLHLIGLIQQEGVHSHLDHLYALLDFCKKENFTRVYLHLITDGRDSPVNKGKSYLRQVEEKTKKTGVGEVVTISGRYFAMDRDKRWERTKKAYRAVAEGKSKEVFISPSVALKNKYATGETDEFITPVAKKDYTGFKENDAVVFFNFRTDRPRQLTQAITEENFTHFKKKHQNVFFVAMTDYYSGMKAESLFKEEKVKNILGEILSKEGIKQLRASETEKYAHVTFFFNNQKEAPFSKEDRLMIPSPKVATYDMNPEMSAEAVTNKLLEKLENNPYDFIVINYANPDMVGHTGDMQALIKALKTVDREMYRIVQRVLEIEGTVLMTADHGNAEEMYDYKEQKPVTAHTTNNVPLILIQNHPKHLNDFGSLCDLAPTILELLELSKPPEMKGSSLIRK